MGRLFVFMTMSVILVFAQISWSTTKTRRSARTVHHAVRTKAVPAADANAAMDSASEALTPEAATPTTAEDFKKMGDRLMRKGQGLKAMEAYKQSLALGGDDTAKSRIALILGQNCYAGKLYEDALRYFDMVTGKISGTLSYKSMLGEALQMTGKNDSAIAILEPFAANQKIPVASRKDMFKTLGDAYMSLKNEDAAVVWYAKYARSGGVKTADMAYLIASSEAKAAPARAALLYDANIKSFPSDYRNYLQLGMVLSKNKTTLGRSAGLLKKAVALADTIPAAWSEIGKIKRLQGKTDEALDAYRNVLRLDHGNLDAKIAMGSLLTEKGSIDDAIKYLELAHKQAPDSVEPMELLATDYTRSGKPKQAVEVLLKLKELKPKELAVRKQLVDAYQSSGQDQKAFEEVQGVLELERDRESLFPYAKMLAKMGKYDEAVAALEEILGAMPDDLEAMMELASVYRQQKKFDEAVSVYKDICTIDPKYAPALYERAGVHLEQGKVKWAQMFYQRALTADPQMALAEVGLAEVALLFNKKDSCDILLSKAEAMAPDDPIVKKEISKVRNPNRVATPVIQDQESGLNDESLQGSEDSPIKHKRKRRQ
jgi:tetratricopeptide (TPR) repeat protein